MESAEFNLITIKDTQNIEFLNANGQSKVNTIIHEIKINKLELTKSFESFLFINLQKYLLFNLSDSQIQGVELIEGYIYLFNIKQVQFSNIIFQDIKYNQNTKRIIEETQSIKKFYIFEFRGCQSILLQYFKLIKIQNTGIANIIPVNLDISIVLTCRELTLSGFQIYDLDMIKSDFPLFFLRSEKIFATFVSFEKIQSHSHIIQAQQILNFYMENSSFQNLTLFKESNFLHLRLSIYLKIDFVQFENIISLQNPSILQVFEVDIIEINKSTFKNNQNLLQDSKIISYYQSNLFFSKCNNLTIINSSFIQNFSLNNGGALYLLQVKKGFISSIFEKNKSKQQSGGAIYISKSDIIIQESIFKFNNAVKERGGAIYTEDSNVTIKNSNITQNKAFIGGGIYQDQNQLQIIQKDNIIKDNEGIFYGNNIGTLTNKSIKRIYLNSNKTENITIIKQFQSGNYTKEEIYLQFFDHDNKQLNFSNINLNEYPLSISSEVQNYRMFIKENNQDILISQGSELELNKAYLLFQLNFTAQYMTKQNFILTIASNIQGVEMQMELEMRDCLIGEIKTKKQSYVQCLECEEEYYSLKDPNSNDEKLQQCMKCPKEALKCKGNSILLEDGYWRSSKLSDVIYQCLHKGCSESNKSLGGCAEGYKGTLCQTCDYKGEIWGQAFGSQDQQCFKCDNLTKTYILLAFTIIIYIAYITASLKSQILNKILIIKLYYLRKLDLLFLSKSRSNSFDISAILKIFMSYLQIFCVTINFFTYIPKIFKDMIDIGGDPANFTYRSYDCLFTNSPIQQLWLNRLIFQFIQILISFIFVFLCEKLLLREQVKKTYVGIQIIFIYLFYYPSMSKLLISFSLCQKIDQKYYMNADYMLECYTKYHMLVSLLFIYPITLLWSIILPFILFIKMRDRVQKKQQNRISYILSYYLIQQGFKEKFYYWEIVKMISKLLIMFMLNLPITQITQKLLCVIICFIYLSLINRYNPYSHKLLMKCEIILMQVLIISITLQAILEVETNAISLYIEYVLVVILILLNLHAVIKVLIIYINLAKLKIKINSDSKLQQLLLKIPFLKKLIFQNPISLMRINTLWKKIYKEIYKQKQYQLLNLNASYSQNYNLKRNIQFPYFSSQQNQVIN